MLFWLTCVEHKNCTMATQKLFASAGIKLVHKGDTIIAEQQQLLEAVQGKKHSTRTQGQYKCSCYGLMGNMMMMMKCSCTQAGCTG
jgi:hypothetical protein